MGRPKAWPLLTKREVADRLLDRLVGPAGRSRRRRADWTERGPAGVPIVSASTNPDPKPAAPVRRLTVSDIARLYADGRRIAMITAYDFPTARLLDEAGLPLLLVGDSLGRAVLGYENEIPVSMDDMLHHAKAVVRGARAALVIGDMPFLSYATPEQAVHNAGRFLAEAGVQAVKVEGGRRSCADDRGDHQGRDPGDGPHRPDPPVDQPDRQGPRPGQDPGGRPRAAGRRPRRPGGGCLLGGPGAGPGAARGGDHRRGSRSRRSGSGQAPAAAARSRS